MARILLAWARGEVVVRLGSDATAAELVHGLPLESTAQTWGEEVYFQVPVAMALREDARDVVAPGTVCFWVAGQSLAIPYGPTPASRGEECRLVEPVNVLGAIEGDPRILASIGAGERLTLTALDSGVPE